MDVFKCDSCHLEFNEKATLLRHVSHKKVCKSHYGESRLNDMRIEGKLTAKRKWWKDHADEAKKLSSSVSERVTVGAVASNVIFILSDPA